MRYLMIYGNFDAVVNSYEEGYDLLISTFGYYDGHEVFFEEYDENEDEFQRTLRGSFSSARPWPGRAAFGLRQMH